MEEGCAQDNEEETDRQDLKVCQPGSVYYEIVFDSRTNESAMIVLRPAAMAGVGLGKSRFRY